MPYIHVDIDMDEFDDDELIGELELRGYQVTKGSGSVSSIAAVAGFDRVEHLSVCGQKIEARNEALALVGNVIGRVL